MRGDSSNAGTSNAPLKKRRLVNGQELVFRRPGEESDEDDEEQEAPGPSLGTSNHNDVVLDQADAAPVAETQRIIIHEED